MADRAGALAVPMRTYDIHEAADFLKIDRSTALDLAGTGELPGAKIGRAWVFLEADLVAYLQDRVRQQTATRRDQALQQHPPRDVIRDATILPRRRRTRVLPILPSLPSKDHLTTVESSALTLSE
jgi:excisionase family DNA binding protein